MTSLEITPHGRAMSWSDDPSRVQLLFMLLGLFHIVLVGARLRFGPFPIEFFFVIEFLFVTTLLLAPPTTAPGPSNRPLDAVAVSVSVLVVVAVFATGVDLVRHGDNVLERLYFSAHRITPLFMFGWIYLRRQELIAGGGLETVKKLIIAGLLLHGLATVGAALSEPVAALVTGLGNVIDAPSDRSLGIVNNVHSSPVTGAVVMRVSGLLKSAPLNAGFIGTLGAIAVFLFYRERRPVFLALAMLALTACVLTFGRGGLVAMLLAVLLGLALMVMTRRIGQLCISVMALGGLAAVGVLVLGTIAGGAFLEIAVQRFSQFLQPDSFESAQFKIDGTKGFFRILIHDNLVFFYAGEGLNNFLLRLRGKLDFNPADTGFVSNGWLLFAYDNGIYYLLAMGGLMARLIADVVRYSPGLLIILLPLGFAVASDNYYAVALEMHAFFWMVLSIVVLFTERDRELHCAAAAGRLR